MAKLEVIFTDTTVKSTLDAWKLLSESDELKKLFYQAAQIVVVRAIEILRENNHVVTGTLWRSVHSAARSKDHSGDQSAAYAGLDIQLAYEDAVQKIAADILETEVGSWIVYANVIESLPDGGYLVKALEQKFPEVQSFLEKGLKKLLKID